MLKMRVDELEEMEEQEREKRLKQAEQFESEEDLAHERNHLEQALQNNIEQLQEEADTLRYSFVFDLDHKVPNWHLATQGTAAYVLLISCSCGAKMA